MIKKDGNWSMTTNGGIKVQVKRVSSSELLAPMPNQALFKSNMLKQDIEPIRDIDQDYCSEQPQPVEEEKQAFGGGMINRPSKVQINQNSLLTQVHNIMGGQDVSVKKNNRRRNVESVDNSLEDQPNQTSTSLNSDIYYPVKYLNSSSSIKKRPPLVINQLIGNEFINKAMADLTEQIINDDDVVYGEYLFNMQLCPKTDH